MKVIAPCPKCTNPPAPALMMHGELNSHLLAICVCANDHRYLVHQAHSPPEIIFSSGTRAYLAGFYSESVASLAAALERGYEAFGKVLLMADGHSYASIDSYWKEIRNQSERQYGAFCAIYFSATKSAWKSSAELVNFRNKVVHKGYICTRKEAHDYGEYVTKSLNVIMGYINDHHHSTWHEYLRSSRDEMLIEANKLLANDHSLELSFAGSSALEWNNPSHGANASFDERLLTTSRYLDQY